MLDDRLWLSRRHRGASLIAALLASTTSAFAAPHVNATWMLNYVGRSTNVAMWDSKMEGTLRVLLPNEMLEPVEQNLGGPPDPVLGSGPDIVLSACRGHDCGDKGFLWVDASAGTALGAVAACPGLPTDTEVHRWNGCRLDLGSLAYGQEALPRKAREALRAWIVNEDLGIVAVNFVGSDGVSRPVDPTAYRVAARYQPSSGGPGFDCTMARINIDRLICSDPELSALDLKLNELYDQMRRGLSDEPARVELRDLEGSWLSLRNSVCAAASNAIGCLHGQYRGQIRRLEEWTPTKRG